MTTYSKTLNYNYKLRLEVTLNSQNVGANTSSVHRELRIDKGDGTGRFSGYTHSWNRNIGGQTGSGSIAGYDFRDYSTLVLNSGDNTITHNADGTKSISVSGTFTESVANIGSGTASGSYTLPTIPRASTPSFSAGSVDAGTSVTINTNRADASFTHDLFYTFGTANGTIAEAVGVSTSWTPPESLLTQIPNTTSGVMTITCRTYNGTTFIGEKSVSLTLTVGSSIIPDFTTVTHEEYVTAVATEVGAYVQMLTRLVLAITGETGVYGSTITARRITVAGQIINAVSGTLPQPLAVSGTVPIVGSVTDSRGRVREKTVNVTVLPYQQPQMMGWVAQRATVLGTPDENGEYLLVSIDAAASSLIVSTVEKNLLGYRILTRVRNVGSFVEQVEVADVGGVTFAADAAPISGYAAATSYDVLVEVFDKFTTTQLAGQIATAGVVLHIGSVGIGAGKYNEGLGSVEAVERMYQRDGIQVVDGDDLVAYLPPGVILDYGGSSAPTGWLLCDGSLVSRTTYAALFAVIGTTYGAGDGSTTFAVPNAKGRVRVAVDSGQTEFDTLGETGGEKAHTLTVAEMPSHNHGGATGSSNISGGSTGTTVGTSTTRVAQGGGDSTTMTNWGGSDHTHTISAQGDGGAHNNLQPFLVVNAIIRT